MTFLGWVRKSIFGLPGAGKATHRARAERLPMSRVPSTGTIGRLRAARRHPVSRPDREYVAGP